MAALHSRSQFDQASVRSAGKSLIHGVSALQPTKGLKGSAASARELHTTGHPESSCVHPSTGQSCFCGIKGNYTKSSGVFKYETDQCQNALNRMDKTCLTFLYAF